MKNGGRSGHLQRRAIEALREDSSCGVCPSWPSFTPCGDAPLLPPPSPSLSPPMVLLPVAVRRPPPWIPIHVPIPLPQPSTRHIPPPPTLLPPSSAPPSVPLPRPSLPPRCDQSVRNTTSACARMADRMGSSSVDAATPGGGYETRLSASSRVLFGLPSSIRIMLATLLVTLGLVCLIVSCMSLEPVAQALRWLGKESSVRAQRQPQHLVEETNGPASADVELSAAPKHRA